LAGHCSARVKPLKRQTDHGAGAKLPAKRRGASIKPAVERLCSECYEKGVLPDALTELIDLITIPNHLDQASLNSIVRNLYPASAVNSDVIINVIGSLGHGALKPSLAIQAALLRWLVMIYHIIGRQNVLSDSYAVLFNLLDTAAIRSVRGKRFGCISISDDVQAPAMSSARLDNSTKACAAISHTSVVSRHPSDRPRQVADRLEDYL
jgi:hypothetical protein